MFCKKCGKEIADDADVCLNCGTLTHENAQSQNSQNVDASSIIKKGWFLAIMCFFFGALGVHRFMTGKIGTGVLWLLTGGCLGIGVLVDFIMLLCGTFTDKEGNKIPLN